MDSTATQSDSTGTSSKMDGIMDAAKDQAGRLAQKSSELTGKTVDMARSQSKSALSSSKDRAATTLKHMGDAFRSSSRQLQDQGHDHLCRYADVAADGFGSVSTYLSDKSIDDLARDTENLARREPALFIGGALALGILAGRFFKSSGPSSMAD